MATSASEWMSKATGKSWASIGKMGVGGALLALFASIITGIQAVFQIFISGFTALADVVAGVIRSFGLEPLGIIDAGAKITSRALQQFGLFAILVAVGLVLAVYLMVTKYLELERTPDWIPFWAIGDIPTDRFGADEDEE